MVGTALSLLPVGPWRDLRPVEPTPGLAGSSSDLLPLVTRVNPAILRWARETAGLSPEEAATKIDLNPTKRATAVERIAALEGGEDEPSRALLLRMSKQYRRPFVSFLSLESTASR